MRLLLSLLVSSMFVAGGATAQDDTHQEDTGHETHQEDAGHDHEDNDAAAGEILIELGEHRYALLPLITRNEGGFQATLVLTTSDAATQGTDHDSANDGNHSGSTEASEGEAEGDHDDDPADEDHADTTDDLHAAPHLSVELLDPSGTRVLSGDIAPRSDTSNSAYSLIWFVDATRSEVDGVWRLVIAGGDHRTEVPIGVVTAASDTTEVMAVFAPAPRLSGAGRTEAFVYAFRDLDAVHAALTVQRSMTGMQHATDEEEVPLIHDHFVTLTDIVPIGDAMANRSGLDFAMVGTWDVTITIDGDLPETFVLAVDMLDE